MESFNGLINIFFKYGFFNSVKKLKNNGHKIFLDCSEHLFVTDINFGLRNRIDFLNNVEIIVEDKLIVGLL